MFDKIQMILMMKISIFKQPHIATELALQKLLYCNQIFSPFGTHFNDSPKTLNYRQVPPNMFYLGCPMKIKVSQAQNNWLVFQETLFTKKDCTNLQKQI